MEKSQESSEGRRIKSPQPLTSKTPVISGSSSHYPGRLLSEGSEKGSEWGSGFRGGCGPTDSQRTVLPGLGLLCAAVLFPRETVAFLQAARRAARGPRPTEEGLSLPVAGTTGLSYLPPRVSVHSAERGVFSSDGRVRRWKAVR